MFRSKTWGLKLKNAGPESRGTGSRDVENAGFGGKRGVVCKTQGLVENAGSFGKRVVWWKTRGLSEKHGVLLFSPKYELSSLK